MNDTIKDLFEQLNKYWYMSDVPERQGECVGCANVQQEILSEIKQMETVEVIHLIDGLTDRQINQLITIVEEIIEAHPQTLRVFKSINEERKLYWLNDELKLLGLIEKD